MKSDDSSGTEPTENGSDVGNLPEFHGHFSPIFCYEEQLKGRLNFCNIIRSTNAVEFSFGTIIPSGIDSGWVLLCFGSRLCGQTK